MSRKNNLNVRVESHENSFGLSKTWRGFHTLYRQKHKEYEPADNIAYTHHTNANSSTNIELLTHLALQHSRNLFVLYHHGGSRLDEIGANIPPVLLYPVLYYAVVGAVCCVILSIYMFIIMLFLY